MKKVLATVVALAFVAGVSFTVKAETKTVEKTKETANKIVTTEKTATKTPEVKAKEEVKTVVNKNTNETKTTIKEKVKDSATHESGKAKVVVTEKNDELNIKAKEKLNTPDMKEKAKEKVVVTTAGKTEDAKVLKKFKDGDIAKEKVVFHSYTNENGGTVTVIKDKKEVKMPARHFENWKANVLGKEKKEVTITSSYDPKLMGFVVTHVE